MIRQITADIYQIGECVPGSSGHEAVRVYVILNAERPVLIDCGSHLHRDAIMAELESLLGGRVPQYIFLTHSELPHAGNLRAALEKWPQIHVMVSNVMLPYIEITPFVPQDQIHAVNPGSTLDPGGRRLVFLSALLKDQPGSHWIYDPAARMLFSGDGFGYYHQPGNCERFSSEVEGGITSEQFRIFHTQAFRFLPWVIPEKMFADLDRLFAAYDIQVIGPTHGNAIFDVPLHLARLKEAIREISTQAPGAQGRA